MLADIVTTGTHYTKIFHYHVIMNLYISYNVSKMKVK